MSQFNPTGSDQCLTKDKLKVEANCIIPRRVEPLTKLEIGNAAKNPGEVRQQKE
jgi:hypothetical protein